MVRSGVDTKPAPVQKTTQLLAGLLSTQASAGAVKQTIHLLCLTTPVPVCGYCTLFFFLTQAVIRSESCNAHPSSPYKF